MTRARLYPQRPNTAKTYRKRNLSCTNVHVEREEYHKVDLDELSNKYMEKVGRGKKRKFATTTIVVFTVFR